ncbi:hypothetical protein BDZ97DRAFT_2063648 [Flammula alnicola]|nr:hypothetical protein BDZ97DRAFT_2063648 [Flammula alnicola]
MPDIQLGITTNPPIIQPVIYSFTLHLYFLVIWFAKASLIISLGRIFRNERRAIWRFKLLSLMLALIGPIYCIAISIVCAKEHIAIDGAIFCSLPQAFVICALIVDIAVDIGIVSLTWCIFIDAKLYPSQKFSVILGFAGSSGWTFISSSICWSVLLSQSYYDPPMVVCLVNIMTAVSTSVCSIPVLLPFIWKKICRQQSTDRFPNESMAMECVDGPVLVLQHALGHESPPHCFSAVDVAANRMAKVRYALAYPPS